MSDQATIPTEPYSARDDFDTAVRHLELCQLAIACAESKEAVLRGVDHARQALQTIVCNAEVLFDE